jgi:hypothetical protein
LEQWSVAAASLTVMQCDLLDGLGIAERKAETCSISPFCCSPSCRLVSCFASNDANENPPSASQPLGPLT